MHHTAYFCSARCQTTYTRRSYIQRSLQSGWALEKLLGRLDAYPQCRTCGTPLDCVITDPRYILVPHDTPAAYLGYGARFVPCDSAAFKVVEVSAAYAAWMFERLADGLLQRSGILWSLEQVRQESEQAR